MLVTTRAHACSANRHLPSTLHVDGCSSSAPPTPHHTAASTASECVVGGKSMLFLPPCVNAGAPLLWIVAMHALLVAAMGVHACMQVSPRHMHGCPRRCGRGCAPTLLMLSPGASSARSMPPVAATAAAATCATATAAAPAGPAEWAGCARHAVPPSAVAAPSCRMWRRLGVYCAVLASRVCGSQLLLLVEVTGSWVARAHTNRAGSGALTPLGTVLEDGLAPARNCAGGAVVVVTMASHLIKFNGAFVGQALLDVQPLLIDACSVGGGVRQAALNVVSAVPRLPRKATGGNGKMNVLELIYSRGHQAYAQKRVTACTTMHSLSSPGYTLTTGQCGMLLPSWHVGLWVCAGATLSLHTCSVHKALQSLAYFTAPQDS